MKFVPCAGRDDCTEGGTHCRGCGRSHAEIEHTRSLIGALAEQALTMGYENAEEYLDYVARKALKKISAGRG